jgi:hypothetical protein
MKKRLQPNVNNAEYFRLTQMYEGETFQDMQRSISEKYAQFMAGPFPESEHQKPYESGGDYQQVEDGYVPWQYPPYRPPPWTPPKWPPQAMGDEEPTPNCQTKWDDFVRSLQGGVMSAKRYDMALSDLIKSGCTKYLPNFCCPNVWEVEAGQAKSKKKRASGDSSIIGPAEVESGSTVQYSYIHGQPGCSYTWSANRGRVVGGTYTAPVVIAETTDEISVTPFMSDDNASPCATRKIKIKVAGDCVGEKIIVLTPTMIVGQTQQLGVLNGQPGRTYQWAVSGGGTITQGGFYQAPAANVDCQYVATVTLGVNGKNCDATSIAISYVTNPNIVAYQKRTNLVCTSQAGVPVCAWYYDSYNCGGQKIVGMSGYLWCGGNPYQGWNCNNPQDKCENHPTCAAFKDLRTAGMKADACCPLELM